MQNLKYKVIKYHQFKNRGESEIELYYFKEIAKS